MKSFLLNNRFNFITGFVISLLITIAVLPFVKLGNKYQLTLTKDLKHNDEIYLYRDLNHDGTSEKIEILKNFEGRSAIILHKAGHATHEWNLHGKIVNGEFICTGDYNNDGSDELYVFTYSSDSIFLNVCYLKNKHRYFPPLFLTKFNLFNGHMDVAVYEPQFIDLNHDNHKELIGIIYGAFSKSIRAVFSINLRNRTLRTSHYAGSSIFGNLMVSDINGKDVITGQILATGNYSPKVPYSDSFEWFYIYNSDLNYVFKPIKLGHDPGRVQIFPFKEKSQNLLVVLATSNLKTDSSFIGIANTKGHFLCHKIIPYQKSGDAYYIKVLPSGKKYKFALYDATTGLVEYLNGHLKTVKKYSSIPFRGGFNPFHSFDLLGDGQKEEVYYGTGMGKLIVSRYDFTSPVFVKIPGKMSIITLFSVRRQNGKPEGLLLSTLYRNYEFSYNKNHLYTFRFLIYAGIFILIFFFVNLIGYYYQRLLKIRYSTAKRIHDNQLKSIEMQLNPHFILNILNSIGALYEKKETQSARVYMGKYSKLLRHTLLTSGHITITLEEELDFVKNYLDLEQFRHDNQFTYNVSCNLELQSIQIPRLLLHTFAENAIKHGLYPILGKQPAILEIQCSESKRFWIIEISDNGIGKKAAKEKDSLSTGKGLKILNETLSLYRSVYHQRITYNMTELNPGTEFPGSKVTILIGKQKKKRKSHLKLNLL